MHSHHNKGFSISRNCCCLRSDLCIFISSPLNSIKRCLGHPARNDVHCGVAAAGSRCLHFGSVRADVVADTELDEFKLSEEAEL